MAVWPFHARKISTRQVPDCKERTKHAIDNKDSTSKGEWVPEFLMVRKIVPMHPDSLLVWGWGLSKYTHDSYKPYTTVIPVVLAVN